MKLFLAGALIYLHLFYREIELLWLSIFRNRQKIQPRCEDIFLESARKMLYFLKITLGVEVEYISPSHPLPQQSIIVSNHQSYFDILIIRMFLAAHNIRFIAYQRLRRRFLGVSRLMRLQNHAFIDRYADQFTSLRTIRGFAKSLVGTSLSPVIFPEGKFEPDGVLLPFFSAGLRQLSTHLDVPIVLLLIRNCHYLTNMSDVMRNPLSEAVKIEAIGCIEDATERKQCVRHIHLLEQKYQDALEARS